MGKLLVPATVFRTVANQVPQLSQPRTTLRQCDSCPYPFRDRAPTVALSREGCWRGKRSVANARAVTDAAPLSHHRADGTAVMVTTLTLHHQAHASLAAMPQSSQDEDDHHASDRAIPGSAAFGGPATSSGSFLPVTLRAGPPRRSLSLIKIEK
jgi:hypothetical protein